jgi:hypothetical protein
VWNRLAAAIPLKRRFLPGMTPWGGSGWWALSRPAAVQLCRSAKERPEIARFFRWVKIPDEMYPQTVLMNSPEAERVVNAPLHFVSWPPLGATSPRVLGGADFAALSAAPQLFARKFDEAVDGDVLDRIDRELLSPRPRTGYSAG